MKKPLRNKKNWTPEEIDFLENNWGTKSISAIASRLQRSDNSIIEKAGRLQLGGFRESGDLISLNQLILAIGYNNCTSYFIFKLKKANIPIVSKKIRTKKCAMIKIEDFWKWAEVNHTLIDFSKFEENALGKEPAWVKQKRRNDFHKHNTRPWTDAETSKLYYLMTKKNLTYLELSKELNRSCGAIQRKICDEGWKYRPDKTDNHIKWTETEVDILVRGIMEYYTYKMLQDELNKSEKAIRGKVYQMYKSENLTKARKEILGKGKVLK